MQKYVQQMHSETTCVGDRVIVYGHDVKRAIVLNPTGSLLWRRLERPQSVKQLVDCLAEEFDTSESCDLAADVDEYVHELLEQGLVDVVAAKS